MWENVHMLYANTTPFYVKDLSILGFWHPQWDPGTNPFGYQGTTVLWCSRENRERWGCCQHVGELEATGANKNLKKQDTEWEEGSMYDPEGAVTYKKRKEKENSVKTLRKSGQDNKRHHWDRVMVCAQNFVKIS